MGAELVIDRASESYQFWKDRHTQDQSEWKRFGSRIRELTGGRDVDIVFEHPGRGDVRRERLRRTSRWHDRDMRINIRIRAPVRQPIPLDEPQADHRITFRQPFRGMSGE